MSRLTQIVLFPNDQAEALQAWWLTEDGLTASEPSV